MASYGILKSDETVDRLGQGSRWAAVVHFVRARKVFFLIVVLPVLLVALYLYVFNADQYESSADFVVKRAETVTGGTNNVGQVLGFSFGTAATLSEAYAVQEFLLSHNAVARLRAEDDIVARFRSPMADAVSRLWYANPSPERLLHYYRRQVKIYQDPESGITHLRVYAFTPDDSVHIARKLLLLGEERINALNERTFRDQEVSARRELTQAEEALFSVQRRLTQFRRVRGDIDPEGTGRAQVAMITGLTSNLVSARSSLQAMEGVISPTSPQYRALSVQVRALQRQLAAQQAQVAGEGQTIAAALGEYEDLVIRREYAARRYAAAAAQLEQARAEANRKQLYLIRVVDANRPVRALFPERGKILLTVAFSLLVAYGIGWLLWAGVKEHQM